MNDDYEKPSRQKRRQKRGWQRKPKMSLDGRPTPWQSCSPVLNTPRLAVAAPVSHSGFFTSIGFCRAVFASTASAQWPGSAQLYNSLRAKSASGSLGRVEVPGRPSTGRQFNVSLRSHHGHHPQALPRRHRAQAALVFPCFPSGCLPRPSPHHRPGAGASHRLRSGRCASWLKRKSSI